MTDIVDINFRDVGGLRSSDGRELLPGLIYRSGHLCELSDDAVRQILATKARCIFDLRHPRERDLFPTNVEIASKTRFRTFERGTTDVPAGDIHALTESKERSYRTMLKAYRELPFVHTEAYRDLFQYLLDDDYPVIVHCAVGKDRTGVGIALILTALGIESAQIMKDYLRSNEAADRTRAVVMKTLNVNMTEPSNEVLEPVIEASDKYLLAMFHELGACHGGTLRYLNDVLGIQPRAIKKLQDRLLRVI